MCRVVVVSEGTNTKNKKQKQQIKKSLHDNNPLAQEPPIRLAHVPHPIETQMAQRTQRTQPTQPTQPTWPMQPT